MSIFVFCVFNNTCLYISVSFFKCVCFCLGSQCLALAPGPTHTSAPLPTLWTRCLKSWGGNASYAWEREMSCVARRSHSEPGPRRFLRLVSWAETLWAELSAFVDHNGVRGLGTLCTVFGFSSWMAGYLGEVQFKLPENQGFPVLRLVLTVYRQNLNVTDWISLNVKHQKCFIFIPFYPVV